MMVHVVFEFLPSGEPVLDQLSSHHFIKPVLSHNRLGWPHLPPPVLMKSKWCVSNGGKCVVYPARRSALHPLSPFRMYAPTLCAFEARLFQQRAACYYAMPE